MVLAKILMLDQVADHCSGRAQAGMPVSGYSAHPDEFVRFAADLGRREGLFVLGERLKAGKP